MRVTYDDLDRKCDEIERILTERAMPGTRLSHGAVSSVAAFLLRGEARETPEMISTLYRYHLWLAI